MCYMIIVLLVPFLSVFSFILVPSELLALNWINVDSGLHSIIDLF